VNDGTAYCAFAGRLLKIVPGADASGTATVADVPPSFELKQSAVALDRAGPSKLTHAVAGGKQPYQFALMTPFAGVNISPNDGTVTVDGPKVIEAALDALVGTLDRTTPSGRGSQGGLTSPVDADAYVARNAANFKQLAGRDPTGVPVALVIGVQATDSTPRTARLTYNTLIEVPRDKIDERIKKIAEARAAAIAAQPKQPAAGGAGAAGGAADDARVQALERRIAALEAQLDLLTKILAGNAAK